MIPKEKLLWTDKDSKDAEAFIAGVDDGSIPTTDLVNLKRDSV